MDTGLTTLLESTYRSTRTAHKREYLDVLNGRVRKDARYSELIERLDSIGAAVREERVIQTTDDVLELFRGAQSVADRYYRFISQFKLWAKVQFSKVGPKGKDNPKDGDNPYGALKLKPV